MTDFLSRLAGRTLGLIPTVKPVIPSRFGSGEVAESGSDRTQLPLLNNEISLPTASPSSPVPERGQGNLSGEPTEGVSQGILRSDRTPVPLLNNEISLPTASPSSPVPERGQGNLSGEPTEAVYQGILGSDRTPVSLSNNEITLPTASPSSPVPERGQGNLSGEPTEGVSQGILRSDRTPVSLLNNEITLPTASPLLPVPERGQGNLSGEPTEGVSQERLGSDRIQMQRHAQDSIVYQEGSGSQSFNSSTPLQELNPNPIDSDSSSLNQAGNLEEDLFITPTPRTPVQNQTVSESGHRQRVSPQVKPESVVAAPDLVETTQQQDWGDIQLSLGERTIEEISATQESINKSVLGTTKGEMGKTENRQNSVPNVHVQTEWDGGGEAEEFAVSELNRSSSPQFPLATATPSVYTPTSPVSGSPPTPTIQVTIGRIEVRAMMPTPAVSRPAAVHPSPALSLNDYLKQRRGGG